MATKELIKSNLMTAAYIAATAVMAGAEGDDDIQASVDPDIQDPEIAGKSLTVYALAKSHYHVLVKALSDKTGAWPDPVLPEGVNVGVGVGQNGVQVLVDVLKGIRPDTPIATAAQLVSALAGVSSQPGKPQLPPLGSDLSGTP